MRGMNIVNKCIVVDGAVWVCSAAPVTCGTLFGVDYRFYTEQ
jgi:hypothetical protein